MEINFPKPSDNKEDKGLNPLTQLEAFCKKFNEIYEGHFLGIITTSSELIDDRTSVINYAFWIDFIKVKDYSYRFFELTPSTVDGGYPLSVTAFHGPPEDFGVVNTPEELQNRLNDILNSKRGRFIILSNY